MHRHHSHGAHNTTVSGRPAGIHPYGLICRAAGAPARALSLLLACAVACGGISLPAAAAQTDSAQSQTEEEAEAAAVAADSAGAEEGETSLLLPGAGFSYSFSARKVSLRDVEDQMYSEGVITHKRTTESDGLTLSVDAAEVSGAEEEEETAAQETDASDTSDTASDTSGDSAAAAQETDTSEDSGAGGEEALSDVADDGVDDTDGGTDDGADDADSGTQAAGGDEPEEEERVIQETALTPVQKKEQSVVDAVSQTQNIEIDASTATILSATAVSVVSDPDTAVALAQMADRKQTQAKLDQGVISAVEAEALLAASQGTVSGAIGTNGDSGAGTGGSLSQDAAGTDAASEDGSVPEMLTDAEGNEMVIAQVDDYINIREDADENSEIVGRLYNGSVATVLGRTGNGWVRIQSGSVYGYIREEYVATGSAAAELAESVATKQAVVTTQTLRVRAAAIADSDVISLIAEGESLEILEEVDGWYKVITPDGEGYISSDFADVEEVYQEAVSVGQEEETADAAGTTDTATGTSASSGRNSLNTYTGSVTVSGSGSGASVANYALQFVGNPYVWGGSSLTNGADCSGFTMAVYASFGVSLPHNSTAQASCGTAVSSLDEAQAGDLLIYDGHVAIYLGNNQIVHASNPTNGITTGTATYRTIIAIRRIFN